MAYKIIYVGAQAHEQTPQLAVYSLDALGRITGKVAVSAGGQLDIARAKSSVIALGPDVADTATLNPEGLITLRLADQLPVWNETGEIQIPSQWWRGWIGFVTCVSGNAYQCTRFFDLGSLRSIALGLGPIILPERCEPLCNAVVEVWEYTTCCWPFLISYLPRFIENLAAFLKANPIMFPVPPQPDPGPLNANLVNRVNAALGAGKISNTFVPSTTLADDLATLRSLPAQDAVTYFEANPRLWPIWCTGSSAKLGETAVNPNGSFSFCYRYFPFFRPNCRNSYFYKVKQLVNGVWTYVYDGSAANQYFSADEVANLYTSTGQTCFQPPPLPGNDYIAFQAIGNTNTWSLNSNWAAATGAGVDQNQSGDTSMVPLITNAGLEVGTGAPWATTLQLLLNYDPTLQSASPSPFYYRMSIVQSDPVTGGPLGGAAPVPLLTPLSWNFFDTTTSPPTIGSQSLGPQTVNGNQGLYQIPYFGGTNPDWLGNQFHQSLDTTKLANSISGGPGLGNGQFLLVLEVFDESGNRLVPPDAPSPLPADTKGTFHYVRLMTPTTTADVQFNSLTHILWVDNRPVVGGIDYFMTSAGVQICQFYQESSTTPFYVGFHAYHAVMCDPAPNPSNSFMSSFGLTWQEGLAGTSGALAQGADTNWGNGCPLPVSTSSPPSSVPPFNVPSVTFGEMLGTDPITGESLTACSFALTLGVYPKHTNGYGTIWGYESITTAAVALSDAPPPPPCIPRERARSSAT
jgi:hypothetical protein